MAYEFLLLPNDPDLDPLAVSKTLRELLGMRTTLLGSHRLDLHYENEDTGAEFDLIISSDPRIFAEIDFVTLPHKQARFYYLVKVPFIRPLCFAKEAMEKVCAIAGALDAKILDDQDWLISQNGEPKAPVMEDLIECWRIGNRRSVVAFHREGALSAVPYMPREEAHKVWNYNYRKHELQAAVPKLFWPKVFFVKAKGENRMSTVATATEGETFALPRVDHVAVIRWKRGFLGLGSGKPTSSEIIAYDTFLNAFQDILEPAERFAPNSLDETLAGLLDGAMGLRRERIKDSLQTFKSVKGPPEDDVFGGYPGFFFDEDVSTITDDEAANRLVGIGSGQDTGADGNEAADATHKNE